MLIIGSVFSTRYASYCPETQMRPESVLDVDGIARRQRARRVLSPYFDGEEARAGCRRMQRAGHLLNTRHVAHRARFRKPARLRHRRQVEAMAGMALLHAGLAEVVVVDHDDHEIARIADRDSGEPAEPHQLLAIAGDRDHGAIRLRLRKTKADQ